MECLGFEVLRRSVQEDRCDTNDGMNEKQLSMKGRGFIYPFATFFSCAPSCPNLE